MNIIPDIAAQESCGMSAPDVFALGGRQHPDAALIGADAEMRRLLADEDTLEANWPRIERLMDTIEDTGPSTLAGCAVKLRLICDPNIGMGVGERPGDVLSLRHVLALIERKATAAEG